jgi:hypothetical protein
MRNGVPERIRTSDLRFRNTRGEQITIAHHAAPRAYNPAVSSF